MKTSRYEIDMCHGPLMGKMVFFTIPIILSSNLQLLFNAVDIIVVGKYSGSLALAAVGSTTALIFLLIALLTGISLGASVMAGQYFASRDDQAMGTLTHTSMAFALWAGLLVGAAGIVLARWALVLMGTPPEVLPQAVLYMRVYYLGMPFFMLYTYGAAILRAVGDTRRPLYFLTAAGILNAGLNMVMVIIFQQGVLGVAVATVVSQLFSCVLVIWCLIKAEGSYRLYLSRLTMDLPCVVRMLRIGLPAGIQGMVINFSNVLLQSSVNTFGQSAMAGYTAAHNVFGFMYCTANSFTQTCMSFMSQNYGVKNWKRMKQVLWQCSLLSVVSMIIISIFVDYFQLQILGIYTADSEAIRYGVEVFRYAVYTYFIFNIMDLLPGAMRGIGYSSVPMILAVVGTVGVRVVWIFCFFPQHHAMDYLFISYPLSWGITVIMQAVYFVYAWKQKRASLRSAHEAHLRPPAVNA